MEINLHGGTCTATPNTLCELPDAVTAMTRHKLRRCRTSQTGVWLQQRSRALKLAEIRQESEYGLKQGHELDGGLELGGAGLLSGQAIEVTHGVFSSQK